MFRSRSIIINQKSSLFIQKDGVENLNEVVIDSDFLNGQKKKEFSSSVMFFLLINLNLN